MSRNASESGSWLSPYINRFKRPFSVAILFLVAEALCDLLQPTLMAHLIDSGIANRDSGAVISIGLSMLGVAGLGALAALGRNAISSKVSQNFGAALRSDLFKKITRLSFEELDGFGTASLTTRVTNDVTQVQNLVNGMMRIFVRAPLTALGGIILAIALNLRMAPIVLIVVPVVAILIAWNMKLGYPFYRKIQATVDRVNGVIREYLGGVRAVKAFNRFDYEKKRFSVANDELSSLTTRVQRVMALFSPGIAFAVNAGIVAVLWFGGIGVSQGTMKTGQVVAFVNYMTQILASLMMIGFIFNVLVRARVSGERIGEVLKSPGRRERQGNTQAFRDKRGLVEFDGVGFRYEAGANEDALRDISFLCEPGDTIGIIGSTGSGKSSLVTLIPGFREATRGTVRVDGSDARLVDRHELRERVALVPQKALLFTGTVLDNLRWGKKGATLSEIEEAALAAQALDFIRELPLGFDTLIGRGGVNLSGGQKQRLSIARALVRRPEILILDDSTSALDAITEMRLRDALASFTQGMSLFLVAQKISSVRKSSKILVLDEGRLAGEGSHETLLEKCQVYRDIFDSQIGQGRLEGEHGR